MGVSISVTDHAVWRYQERVRPGLELADARRDLLRLLKGCEVTTDLPDWTRDREDRVDAVAVLSDGVVLALIRERGSKYRAVTCLVRGGMGEQTRARRNAWKAKRRAARHARNRKKPYDRDEE